MESEIVVTALDKNGNKKKYFLAKCYLNVTKDVRINCRNRDL